MNHTEELTITIDRLAAAAATLEQLASRIVETDESTITRIVAQVEDRFPVQDRRASELEQKLAAAEARIAELEAAAGAPPLSPHCGDRVGSRKTIPTSAANLLSKHGVSLDSIEAGTLDAALAGLSLEQRFAVKAQLLRTGLLS